MVRVTWKTSPSALLIGLGMECLHHCQEPPDFLLLNPLPSNSQRVWSKRRATRLMFFSFPFCKDPFLSLPELPAALTSEVFFLQDRIQSGAQSQPPPPRCLWKGGLYSLWFKGFTAIQSEQQTSSMGVTRSVARISWMPRTMTPPFLRVNFTKPPSPPHPLPPD